MVGSCQRIPVLPTPLSCQESPQSESRASFPRIPRRYSLIHYDAEEACSASLQTF